LKKKTFFVHAHNSQLLKNSKNTFMKFASKENY
jgi:hypothetical protein